MVIHDSGTEFITSNIAEDLMAVLRSAFGEGILDIDADFCGGTVKRSVRAGFRKLTRLYRRWGLRAAPVLFAAVPALFLINLINNLRMLFITPPANPPPDYCSTVIVQIRLLQSRSSSII